MGGLVAVVALGGNLGDSHTILLQAIAALRQRSRCDFRASSLYRSEPEHCPPGSPPFLNAVVCFEPLPGETPESLLEKLQQLERTFGRQPKQVLNEARLLDLDLISFGQETRDSRELTLPHPRALLRRFVLDPLAEIAPDLCLPGCKSSVAALASSLGGKPLERLDSGERR